MRGLPFGKQDVISRGMTAFLFGQLEFILMLDFAALMESNIALRRMNVNE
jgi:hypothetical protein